MEQERFDGFVRLLGRRRPRRTVAAALAAALLAPAGTPRPAAAACKPDRRKCKNGGECCSSFCIKKQGVKRCRNAKGSKGCTIEDVCDAVPCPEEPSGACAVTTTGKPFCYNSGPTCFDCETNDDCDNQFGTDGGHCVVDCEACPGTNGFACVLHNK